MALFDTVRRQLALRKARRRARENPSPSALTNLAQTYFDLGHPQEAFRTLEHATNLFPDSELLRNLTAHLRRADFERQVRLLCRLVEETPEDANAHLALAEIYLSVRDTNKVLEVVSEALEYCPDSAALRLVAARARMQRFARDFSERDCVRAVGDLEQVVSAEPENYPACRLLGQVLFLLGYHRRAAQLLEPYVQYNPWDEVAQRWFDEAQSGPGVSETLLLEQAIRRAAQRGEFPVDVGWEGHPAELAVAGSRAVSRALVVSAPERVVRALARRGGLRAAVWSAPEGTRILTRGEGLTEENVLALAEVAATGERACLDMDIGRLEQAVVAGPGATAVLVGFANGVLVSLFSEAVRSQEADRRLQAALRAAGVLAEETSRA